MRNDQDRTVFCFFLHTLKYLDQVLEAPQINTGFRLIKYGKLCTSCQYRSNFDTF